MEGKDTSGIAGLLADDVVYERPFVADGVPVPRRIEGREAYRAELAKTIGVSPIRSPEIRDVVVHEALDPEVIIAEFVFGGESALTGERFAFRNIMVLRVTHGEIVAARDYADPMAVAELFAPAVGTEPHPDTAQARH